jgi:ABC-type transport system involved in Fe-S cluster assembly fused permease/ATPase subunit
MNQTSQTMSKLHTIIGLVWCDKTTQKRLVLTLVITLIVIGLNAISPLFLKYILNLLLTKNNLYSINVSVVCYACIWLMHQAFLQLKIYLTNYSIESFSCALKEKLLTHLLSLSIPFHANRKTGQTINLFNQLHRGLESIFWGLFSYVFPTFLELILIATLLTYLYGYKFGFIALFTSILYILLNVIAVQKIQKAQKKYNSKTARAMATLADILLNIETICFFNNQKYECSKLSKEFYSQKKAAIERDFSESLLQALQLSIIGASLLITLILVVNNQNLNVSDFILINTYILQFTTPLQHIGYLMRQIGKGIQDISYVLNLFTEEANPLYLLPKETIKTCTTTITLKNVSFGYQAENLILKNISFDIPDGKTVAIVGPTGSGKSTIAKLLFRFYDVHTGKILLNGTDIRSLAPQTLSTFISIVPQEPTVFNDTILNNIRYGNLNATPQEIETAIQQAELDSFITSLPKGLNTVVGERGLKISGGEKQRIAIARALIKQPLILILDEASSSLDMHTELKIQHNIRTAYKKKSTVIIAHRLSAVSNADSIVVLDKGYIVEQGTHQELLNIHKGVYANLWNTQHKHSV